MTGAWLQERRFRKRETRHRRGLTLKRFTLTVLKDADTSHRSRHSGFVIPNFPGTEAGRSRRAPTDWAPTRNRDAWSPRMHQARAAQPPQPPHPIGGPVLGPVRHRLCPRALLKPSNGDLLMSLNLKEKAACSFDLYRKDCFCRKQPVDILKRCSQDVKARRGATVVWSVPVTPFTNVGRLAVTRNAFDISCPHLPAALPARTSSQRWFGAPRPGPTRWVARPGPRPGCHNSKAFYYRRCGEVRDGYPRTGTAPRAAPA